MSACRLARVAQVPLRVHVEPVQPRLQTANRTWGRDTRVRFVRFLTAQGQGLKRAVLAADNCSIGTRQLTLFKAGAGSLRLLGNDICGLCIHFIVTRVDSFTNAY